MPAPDPPVPGPAPGEGPASTRVGAVVALKPLARAKTRLRPPEFGSELPDPLRRRLAWTMALDTLAALAGAVHRVLVISDEPALQARLRSAGVEADVVGEPEGTGMNVALAHGDRLLRAGGFATVLACVGDLPALTSAAVATVLGLAPAGMRCFVADATGIGTTMLISRGPALDPHFEGGSADAHRVSGALDLVAGPAPVPERARRDVDTLAELDTAVPLGLGPHTSALLDPATGRLAGHTVITAAGAGQAITEAGIRLPLAGPAELITVRRGQRLHAAVGGGRILSAWL